MERNENEVNRKQSDHNTFTWHDPYSTYVVILEVDDGGKPVSVEYGSKTNWYSYHEDDEEFVGAVKKVMRTFLDYNMDEFKKMRKYLNMEYYEIAEEERRLAATRSSSEYDF